MPPVKPPAARDMSPVKGLLRASDGPAGPVVKAAGRTLPDLIGSDSRQVPERALSTCQHLSAFVPVVCLCGRVCVSVVS